jgi:hypothetical protein
LRFINKVHLLIMNEEDYIRPRYVISKIIRSGPELFRVQYYKPDRYLPESDGLLFRSLDDARRVVPSGYAQSSADTDLPDLVEMWV